jgi:hypothetical protein
VGRNVATFSFFTIYFSTFSIVLQEFDFDNARVFEWSGMELTFGKNVRHGDAIVAMMI